MAVLSGEGCTLGYSADGSSFAEVTQVVSMSGPEQSLPQVETTHLGSTRKEYRTGLKEGETFNFQLYFDPANTQHAAIEAATGEFHLEVTLTDGTAGTSYAFPCLKTGFALGGMEVDSNVTADVEVILTGNIS